MQYCKKCLMPDTRPFTTFVDGVCGACRWCEEKKTVDWNKRKDDLKKICDKFRNKSAYDVIVPCSGGKDGSYVAWKLKNEFGMNPLSVTFAAPMWSELGKKNIENFQKAGFSHMLVTPNFDVYKALNKRGFVNDGYPKRGFVAGLAPSITKVSIGLNIPFVMWGEHEEEYEGVRGCHSKDYKITYDNFLNADDFCGHDPKEYLDQFSEREFYWWLMPSQEEMDKAGSYQTYWSRFEPWDDDLHRKLAVEKCGLQGNKSENVGTFTTHSQVDDLMQPFFMYMAFVKFGFGRATADVSLAIRLGRMTRDEGIEVVKQKEGIFPIEHFDGYIEHFRMTAEEFWKTISKHVNHDIMKKGTTEDRPWMLKNPVC